MTYNFTIGYDNKMVGYHIWVNFDITNVCQYITIDYNMEITAYDATMFFAL